MFAKYKNIIIVVIIVIAGFFVYTNYFQESAVSDSLIGTSGSTSPDSKNIDVDSIVKEINRMRAIKLDTSVFEDPVIKSLQDKSKPLTKENVSRDNPFAPINPAEAKVTRSTGPDISSSSATSTSTSGSGTSSSTPATGR